MSMLMDDWTRGHLERWAWRTVPEDERERAVALCLSWCERHAEEAELMDWPAILRAAENE